MRFDTEAIVSAIRPHGEHGTIVRLLTPEDGLIAAYVRGGRGRRMRPVLIPGNLVSAQIRSRSESQLPQASIELARSRAPLMSEPLQSSAIEWASALVASALPERQPYPRIYQAFAGLLDAIEAAPSAKGWSSALARFEQVVIAELGYGRSGESPAGVFESLRWSGDRLFGDVLGGRTDSLRDCRSRLIDRLRRALV